MNQQKAPVAVHVGHEYQNQWHFQSAYCNRFHDSSGYYPHTNFDSNDNRLHTNSNVTGCCLLTNIVPTAPQNASFRNAHPIPLSSVTPTPQRSLQPNREISRKRKHTSCEPTAVESSCRSYEFIPIDVKQNKLGTIKYSKPESPYIDVVTETESKENLTDTQKTRYLDHLPIRKRHHYANEEIPEFLSSNDVGRLRDMLPTIRRYSPLIGSDKNSSGYSSEVDENMEESLTTPPGSEGNVTNFHMSSGLQAVTNLQQETEVLEHHSPKINKNIQPIANYVTSISKPTPTLTTAGNTKANHVSLVNSTNYQQRLRCVSPVFTTLPTHGLMHHNQNPLINVHKRGTLEEFYFHTACHAPQHLQPSIISTTTRNVSREPITNSTCIGYRPTIPQNISIPKPITSVIPVVELGPSTIPVSNVSDPTQYAPLKRAPGRTRSNHLPKDAQARESSFICEVCDKVFPLQRLLNRHMKCHNSNKCYQCIHCGKGFNDTFDLKRHVRTHTGVRPYRCEKCEKSFTQRCSLESHLAKVHGLNHEYIHKQRRLKLYVCEECGYTDTNVDSYYDHIKGKHPESMELRKYQDKVQFQKLLKNSATDKQ